jgi:hypothetical protein
MVVGQFEMWRAESGLIAGPEGAYLDDVTNATENKPDGRSNVHQNAVAMSLNWRFSPQWVQARKSSLFNVAPAGSSCIYRR